MKSDAVFQEKYDDLKLQMAMHLLREKELEAAEEEIKALNAQPEYQPNPQEEQMMMKVIDRTLQRQRWKHALKTASRMIQIFSHSSHWNWHNSHYSRSNSRALYQLAD